jgi:hypothetical protein
MSRGQTITEQIRLVTETCFSCGVVFAMESRFQERLAKNPGKNFYCPNGHSQHYVGKSWEQRLKEKDEALERERRRTANAEEQVRIERASLTATRGHLTRAKKKVERVEKGVCPHCNRHFVNVARHMNSRHADAHDHELP